MPFHVLTYRSWLPWTPVATKWGHPCTKLTLIRNVSQSDFGLGHLTHMKRATMSRKKSFRPFCGWFKTPGLVFNKHTFAYDLNEHRYDCFRKCQFRNGWFMGWHMRLSKFDIDIRVQKDIHNTKADALFCLHSLGYISVSVDSDIPTYPGFSNMASDNRDDKDNLNADMAFTIDSSSSFVPITLIIIRLSKNDDAICGTAGAFFGKGSELLPQRATMMPFLLRWRIWAGVNIPVHCPMCTEFERLRQNGRNSG